MVIVGAARRHAGAVAVIALLVGVGHVGRVVVVRHDDRAAPVSSRDDREQVALGRLFLVHQPAGHPRVVEVGGPAEGQRASQRLAVHLGRGNALAVIVEQVVAEGVEVPAVVGQQALRHRVAHTVGVVLVEEPSLGQRDDRLPVRHFERAPRRRGVSQRFRHPRGLAGWRRRGFDQGADGRGKVGAGWRLEPVVERLLARQRQELAGQAARQRTVAAQVKGVEKFAHVPGRRQPLAGLME